MSAVRKRARGGSAAAGRAVCGVEQRRHVCEQSHGRRIPRLVQQRGLERARAGRHLCPKRKRRARSHQRQNTHKSNKQQSCKRGTRTLILFRERLLFCDASLSNPSPFSSSPHLTLVSSPGAREGRGCVQRMRARLSCNTKGYSSTYLAMAFANVQAGTWYPSKH